GVVQLCQRLVAAAVEVAALDPGADAGPADRAVAQAGGVDAARRRAEADFHRHQAAPRLFRLRADVDQAEVVQRHQRGVQAPQLGLVVGLALVPVHQLLQQFIADDGLRVLAETGPAQQVALAAGPAQVDVGGMRGAGHLDPARGEVGVEITARRQRLADPGAAGVVGLVVEDGALARRERGQRRGHRRVLAGGALDRDPVAAHPHRLARLDGDDDLQLAVASRAVAVARCAGFGGAGFVARVFARGAVAARVVVAARGADRRVAVAALDGDDRRV